MSETTVRGLGTIRRVSVRLNGVKHRRFSDLSVLLVGPTGIEVRLAVGIEENDATKGSDLTFGSTVISTHPDDSATRVPAPQDDSLAIYNGTNPNGVWRLYVNDKTSEFSGVIENGWTILIEAEASMPALADVCGRVVTTDGRGIGKVRLSMTGGFLADPVLVSSNPFGYFCFRQMDVGQTYTIAANSKRYTFENAVQFAVLLDEITDMRFIAMP